MFNVCFRANGGETCGSVSKLNETCGGIGKFSSKTIGNTEIMPKVELEGPSVDTVSFKNKTQEPAVEETVKN